MKRKILTDNNLLSKAGSLERIIESADKLNLSIEGYTIASHEGPHLENDISKSKSKNAVRSVEQFKDRYFTEEQPKIREDKKEEKEERNIATIQEEVPRESSIEYESYMGTITTEQNTANTDDLTFFLNRVARSESFSTLSSEEVSDLIVQTARFFKVNRRELLKKGGYAVFEENYTHSILDTMPIISDKKDLTQEAVQEAGEMLSEIYGAQRKVLEKQAQNEEDFQAGISFLEKALISLNKLSSQANEELRETMLAKDTEIAGSYMRLAHRGIESKFIDGEEPTAIVDFISTVEKVVGPAMEDLTHATSHSATARQRRAKLLTSKYQITNEKKDVLNAEEDLDEAYLILSDIDSSDKDQRIRGNRMNALKLARLRTKKEPKEIGSIARFTDITGSYGVSEGDVRVQRVEFEGLLLEGMQIARNYFKDRATELMDKPLTSDEKNVLASIAKSQDRVYDSVLYRSPKGKAFKEEIDALAEHTIFFEQLGARPKHYDEITIRKNAVPAREYVARRILESLVAEGNIGNKGKVTINQIRDGMPKPIKKSVEPVVLGLKSAGVLSRHGNQGYSIRHGAYSLVSLYLKKQGELPQEFNRTTEELDFLVDKGGKRIE